VRDSAVNAFATPGGFIIVNSGLIEATKTPEELAGVLAHEVQHVVHRHTTRAIIREAPLRIALSALAGGGSEIGTAANVVGTLGVLRYRRGDEAEADRDGLRLLEAARVDPAGMVSFMRALEARHEDAPRFIGYLSTHPHAADRVNALEALAAAGRGQWRPVLDAKGWRRVREVCHSSAATSLRAVPLGASQWQDRSAGMRSRRRSATAS
jgi:beta-barrel assembly-enhancing protease